jgi:hypothetical protein
VQWLIKEKYLPEDYLAEEEAPKRLLIVGDDEHKERHGDGRPPM